MKNQYVGDIGDYGKYGLLRFLARHGIKIGINWYLTENDDSADGRFTNYLVNPDDRYYDPELYDAMKKIAFNMNKTVQMVEEAELIPEAVYYNSILKSNNLEVSAREWGRRLWFNNSTLLLQDADLIFADPDNGISYRKTARNKDSEKFVLPQEIAEYYIRGKNVVYYCHKGRRKQEAWEQAKTGIREYIRDAQILAVTCHRGTQRSYIFVVHPDCCQRYEGLIADFLSSTWGNMFTREKIEGNLFPDTYKKAAVMAGIPLEPLDINFSICKVTDYSCIDIDNPFVFTGRTDEERSLVCPVDLIPENIIVRDDGWRAFRICGVLDFSLIGILSRITGILAENKIGIFAISTYNTDYILTREENFKKALHVLKGAGYRINGDS